MPKLYLSERLWLYEVIEESEAVTVAWWGSYEIKWHPYKVHLITIDKAEAEQKLIELQKGTTN